MKFNNSIISIFNSKRTISKFAMFFALFLITYCDTTEPPIDPPVKDVWTVLKSRKC